MDGKLNAMRHNLLYWLVVAFKKLYNWRGIPQLSIEFDWRTYFQSPQTKASTPFEWLAGIIHDWQPDIIHTLGMDTAGRFYFQTRNEFHLQGIGKWILQLRGGSDLTLSRHDSRLHSEIREIMLYADQVISDNLVNFDYLSQMGVSSEKFASISPIPGTGGVDVQGLANLRSLKTSQSRIIVWPKAYDCEWSVALPVFEALKMVWDRIQPCEIYMFVMVTPGTQMWYNALPSEIRRHCIVSDRVPRNELLDLMLRARVMLAPSLVDGVPNSLYEAMAAGVFPIVSPLETIVPVVKNEENVLFARNLYPQEIADALLRVMLDDEFVNLVVERNLHRVSELADRSALTPRIVDYYASLAKRDKA
jgi:glycosyltransferase involved in cell wall biosynthesis